MFAGVTLMIALVMSWIAPAPRIDSVAPPSPAQSASAQTLTITGDGFQAGLRLDVTSPSGARFAVQGDAIRARSETSFQASMALAEVGKYELVVSNPDGQSSSPFAIDVKGRSAESPAIVKVTPAEVVKRPEPQALQVEGSRFATGLKALVTDPAGADVTDVVVSKLTPNQFELMVKLEMSGDYSLVVMNPSGAVSNVFTITVR